MKIVHGVLVWLVILGMLAAGVAALYIAVLGTPAALAPYLASRVWRLAAGVAAVVVAVLAAATAFPDRRRDERFISFEGDAGTVSISVRAVTDFLTKASREFAGILGLEARIPSREEPIEILLDVKLKAGSNIPELCRLLQQHVRTSMRETIGISDISAVRVKVREIVAEPPVRPGRESATADWQNG
jgi:uncharacterized alkaline shock family protein YloU